MISALEWRSSDSSNMTICWRKFGSNEVSVNQVFFNNDDKRNLVKSIAYREQTLANKITLGWVFLGVKLRHWFNPKSTNLKWNYVMTAPDFPPSD